LSTVIQMLPLPLFPKFSFSIRFCVQFLCISYFCHSFSVQLSMLTTELACMNVHTKIPWSNICVTLTDLQKCLMFHCTEPEVAQATYPTNSICTVAWHQSHVLAELFCHWTSCTTVTCKAEKSMRILTLNINPLKHNGYYMYHLL
jgi:hypothetical protein